MKTALAILTTVASLALAGCATVSGGPPADGAGTTAGAPTGTESPTAGPATTVRDLAGASWRTPTGEAAPPDVVNVVAGPDHCDWQSSVWLHLGWPVGTPAETADGMRQYVRDPHDVLPGSVDTHATLDTDATLPDEATATGYHVDGVELWLGADGGDDAVYVAFDDHVERWPRTSEVIACA